MGIFSTGTLHLSYSSIIPISREDSEVSVSGSEIHLLFHSQLFRGSPNINCLLQRSAPKMKPISLPPKPACSLNFPSTQFSQRFQVSCLFIYSQKNKKQNLIEHLSCTRHQGLGQLLGICSCHTQLQFLFPFWYNPGLSPPNSWDLPDRFCPMCSSFCYSNSEPHDF